MFELFQSFGCIGKPDKFKISDIFKALRDVEFRNGNLLCFGWEYADFIFGIGLAAKDNAEPGDQQKRK